MTEATIYQFVEGQNWDNLLWVWRHFQQLPTLARAIRFRLEEMMKLQQRFHEFIHDCDYQHMEYSTTEAISYELFSCLALLAWEEDGEAEPAEVERHLRACASFYRWAMMPAKRRTDRSLEDRAMNRLCRRGTRAVLAARRERPGPRLAKRSLAVRHVLLRSSKRASERQRRVVASSGRLAHVRAVNFS